MDERTWTVEDLERVCALWQHELHLHSWRITIRFVHHYSLRPSSQGDVNYTRLKRAACVDILRPEDYEPRDAFPQDIEKTIVHELLHLVLADVCPEDESDAEEIAIELLSRTLVGLKRFF